MNEYLFLMKGDDSQEASPQEMQQRMQDYMGWMQKMMGEGREVSGQILQPTGVHLTNQETVLTDGPFLEPKEIIGGYILINAKDLEEATTLAQSCPLLQHCEMYVRPLMVMPG